MEIFDKANSQEGTLPGNPFQEMYHWIYYAIEIDLKRGIRVVQKPERNALTRKRIPK